MGGLFGDDYWASSCFDALLRIAPSLAARSLGCKTTVVQVFSYSFALIT
jgi:hypothetical protein